MTDRSEGVVLLRRMVDSFDTIDDLLRRMVDSLDTTNEKMDDLIDEKMDDLIKAVGSLKKPDRQLDLAGKYCVNCGKLDSAHDGDECPKDLKERSLVDLTLSEFLKFQEGFTRDRHELRKTLHQLNKCMVKMEVDLDKEILARSQTFKQLRKCFDAISPRWFHK